MADRNKTVVLFREFDNVFCLADIGGERFFYEDGNTCLYQGFCKCKVFAGRCGYGDGIDFSDKLCCVLNRFAAVLFCEAFCLVEVDIDYGGETALGQVGVNAGVDFAHFAGAHDSSAKFIHKKAPAPFFSPGTFRDTFRSDARCF